MWRAAAAGLALLASVCGAWGQALLAPVSPPQVDLSSYARTTDVPAIVQLNAPVKSVTGRTGNVQTPTVCSPVTAGTAVGGTTTETAFSNTCTIPANTIQAGTSVLLHVGGIYSAQLSQAAIGRVYYTNNATIVVGSDPNPISTGSLSGLAGQTGLNEWWGDVWITFYSLTQMDVQGILFFQTTATPVSVMIGNNSTFTYDATKDLKFYLTVQWSSNNGGNSMNLRTMNMK